MSKLRRVLLLVVSTLTLLLAACGGDDDSSGPPPQVAGLIDETGDGIALIGEDVTLLGVTGGDVEVTIGGVAAPAIASDEEGTTVRVPAGVAAGTVPVVAANRAGASDPVALQVRRLAYTADFSNLTLSVLDVDGTVVTPLAQIAVDVPPGPFAVAFTPDGRRAVAACGIGFLPDIIVAALAPGAPPGDSVAIVDVIAGETVAVVRTGEDSIPTGVAVHPDGQTAYVTNYAASTVSVIDLDDPHLVANIDVPRQPEEIAVRPDGAVLLVNSVSGSVSLIDTATLEILSTIETGGNDPSGVAWSADGQTGYVVNSFTNPNLGDDGTLSILDLSDPANPTVTSTLTDGIGPTPYDIDLVPGSELAVITNLNVIFDPISIGPGSVALLNLDTTAVTTVAVGSAPIRAGVSSDGAVALAGNGLEQSVSVIDLASAEVVDTVDLDTRVGPADVAIQP